MLESLKIQSVYDALDWIPFVSCATNLFHIFARAVKPFKPESMYSQYLADRTIVMHIALAIPYLNLITLLYLKLLCPRFKLIQKLRLHGSYLEHAHSKYKDDKTAVLTAISSRWYALQYASDRLKNDKECVIHAVKKNGHALGYAPSHFRRNKDIAQLACKNYAGAYAFLSDELKKDRDVQKTALTADGGMLFMLPEEDRDDEELCLLGLAETAEVFKYCSKRLQDDRDFVTRAISINPKVIDYIEESVLSKEAADAAAS